MAVRKAQGLRPSPPDPPSLGGERLSSPQGWGARGARTIEIPSNCVSPKAEKGAQYSQGEAPGAERLAASEVGDAELIESASQVKRFFERWQADPEFREQLLIDPDQTAARYNLPLDPDELRPLWDPTFNQGHNRLEAPVSPSIKRFQEFVERFTPSDTRKELLATPREPWVRAWWQRQTARIESQLRPGSPVVARTYPLCFELSKGCSVGCWFCGVSASRLENVFAYNSENRQLWRDVLGLMKQILGPMAGAGFCYAATDPLDNPDYEKFCSDYHEILGVFPQTTTAQPLKDPARTRELLKLAWQKGQRHNRFSILSLKMLAQVHEEFSAEELAFVGLELQNKEIEAEEPKVNAGRARKRYEGHPESEKEDADLSDGSISTVMGFLFNMVDRTVKLVSPCIANDRWPDGYRIHDQRTFSDIKDLETVLEEIIANQMPLTVRPRNLIHFRPDLKYEGLPDGFQLSTKFKAFKFRNGAYAKQLGELIHQSDKTAEDIAARFDAWSISQDEVLQSLDLLFAYGVLDDEPDLIVNR